MDTRTAEITAAKMTTGSVTSRDGTPIGYRRAGQGPSVVLLHGSNESAGSHTHLAMALADACTVYLPDRRGRGLSGPHGPDYGIRTEVEDLHAVLAESGAEMVFGVSAGGLVVLEAARTTPAIRKVAVYEPALLMDGTAHTAWVPRFDREMVEGNVAAALVTSMKGLELGPPAFRLMPRRLLEAITKQALQKEDREAPTGTVTMRELAPTLHYEGLLLAEMAGTIDRFRTVSADVLLMGGSNGLPFLKPALDALARTLPHNRRAEFPGLDHGGSSDISDTNRGGKPEVVAPMVRGFFLEA